MSMNILFVDDQSNVLSSILISTNWREKGFSSVFSASSAARAKEIMQDHRVDILVTDIEMPGEDGLSLISWVRKNNYETECIVLTSHADFFYAQQAIQLHISDYVLQPVRPEDLEKAVAKVRDRLKNKADEGEKKPGLSKGAYYTALRDFFTSWPHYNEFIAKPGLFEEKTRAIREYDAACTEEVSMLISLAHITKWRDLPVSPYTFLEKYQKLLAEFTEAAGFTSVTYLQAPNIYISLIYHVPEAAVQGFLQSFSAFPGRVLQNLNAEIRLNLCRADLVELRDGIDALLKNDKDMTKKGTATSGKPVLISFDSYTDAFHKDTSDDYFERILQYIKVNIGEAISRTQIAEALFVSPGYVGAIVKAKTGISCRDFITQEKMKYAKHLLQNTALPVGEVAKNCGYDNFAYFSKVYKDFYGISPSAIRKDRK